VIGKRPRKRCGRVNVSSKNVFDAIQDGISVLDRNLTIIDCNRWIEDRYAEHMPLVGKNAIRFTRGYSPRAHGVRPFQP